MATITRVIIVKMRAVATTYWINDTAVKAIMQIQYYLTIDVKGMSGDLNQKENIWITFTQANLGFQYFDQIS